MTAVLGASAGLAAEDPGHAGAQKLVLRLPDVGRGYVIGDDSGCGALGTENAPPSVAQVAVTYYPVFGCSMEFERLWRARKRTPARGAPFVSSAAFVFASDDGVRAGFGVGKELLAYELGLESKDLAPRSEPPALGDETSVFFVADAFALGRSGRPGLAVLWRRGRVLGVIYVVGLPEAKAKQVALPLARRQETRIEKPTPLPPGVNDDRKVMLDNPRLGITVYWLGLRAGPGHGLPPLELSTIFGPLRYGPDEPGYRASLQYEGKSDGVVLDLWKPRRWARFRRSKLGRGFWDRPCARKRIVQLTHGHAELFRSCARAHFVAHVYLPDLVIDAGPYCMRCEAGSGAYGSFKGLTAIARGLHRRHRRAP